MLFCCMRKRTRAQKSEREIENETREHWTVNTEIVSNVQCAHMNMGLKMFCKDLIRLQSIHHTLCFWAICCLFIAVVIINKPIYDIIEIFLFVFGSIQKYFATDMAKSLTERSIHGRKRQGQKDKEAKMKRKSNYFIFYIVTIDR